MLLKQAIHSRLFSHFLVDAAGVLHAYNGTQPDTIHAFSTLQQYGQVFLTTNNSYSYPCDISSSLHSLNITIHPDHIFSSGHGLGHDPDILSILHNKRVYFVGTSSSYHYLHDASIRCVVDTLADSDVIVLAAYTDEHSSDLIDDIAHFCITHPTHPIICCNPDRVVATQSGTHYVMGYFAETIESRIQRSLIWFGKPYANFSLFVQKKLTSFSISCTPNICFFDDNLYNVVSMQTHLGITGCWVKDTGIQRHDSSRLLIQTYGSPDYIMSSLSLEAPMLKYPEEVASMTP